MALGPNSISKNKDKIVSDLEKIIDEKIKSSDSNVVLIGNTILPQYYKVRNEIEILYKKAGWKVRWISDQLDGDYLELIG